MNELKNRTRGARAVRFICAVAVFPVAGTGANAGEPIPLPKADKQTLDKYLGPDVVGKPVEGEPFDDPAIFVPMENTTWRYRMTSGDHKGKVIDHKFSAVKDDPSGANWKAKIGNTDIIYLRKTDDGSVEFVSHPEFDTGLSSSNHPPAPLLKTGLKPGESHKTKFEVKVSYLDNPEKVKHSGHLELTLTYIGAYEVKTPAGTFKAALVKSDYTGKVGPASVEDFQYRLFAKGIGIVAMVEEKHVSAYLLYKDNTLIGKVLEEVPAAVKQDAGQ